MKKLEMIICLLVCLLLVNLPLAMASSSITENTKIIARTEIWKDINAGAEASAAIAIMDAGKIVYSEGFGMANREKSIPINKNTFFNIGSVSKVYTATAIMLLVDEGKVDLDKPIVHYLPEFSMLDKRYKDITVRMTLNHTSGLPGTTGANNFGFGFNSTIYQDLLETLSQSHLKHTPGEMTTYCNDGFTLAEMIVAKVSGQSFIDFLNERVCKPLSLNNTGQSIGQRQESKEKQAAKFYPPGKTSSEPLEILSVLGAGGLSASAEDLCRFVDTFSGKGPQILSPKALQEIKKTQPAIFSGKLRSPDITWGLGWDVTDLPEYSKNGIKILGKGGNTGTYTAQVFTAPDQRISVAIVSTGRVGSAPDIANKVLSAYLIDKGLLTATPKTITPPVKPQPFPTDLKAFEGYYSNGSQLVKITLDEEKCTMNSYEVEGGNETPQPPRIYNSGYFYKDANKVYFAEIDGTRYLIQHVDAPFAADIIGMEKLEPVTAPQQLVVDLNGTKWLRRNVKPFEGTSALSDHICTSALITTVPGYVDFSGVKKIQSPHNAGMPVKSCRDLSELRLLEKDNAVWAWSNGELFMPVSLAEDLTNGENSLFISADGYNQWRKITSDSILRFEKPSRTRILLFSAANSVLYDSAMDNGEVFAPTGSFVEVAGYPNDYVTIKAAATEN